MRWHALQTIKRLQQSGAEYPYQQTYQVEFQQSSVADEGGAAGD
jgi:hypothetical protein